MQHALLLASPRFHPCMPLLITGHILPEYNVALKISIYFPHPFLHSSTFMQQIFIELLLCASHWIEHSIGDKSPCFCVADTTPPTPTLHLAYHFLP